MQKWAEGPLRLDKISLRRVLTWPSLTRLFISSPFLLTLRRTPLLLLLLIVPYIPLCWKGVILFCFGNGQHNKNIYIRNLRSFSQFLSSWDKWKLKIFFPLFIEPIKKMKQMFICIHHNQSVQQKGMSVEGCVQAKWNSIKPGLKLGLLCLLPFSWFCWRCGLDRCWFWDKDKGLWVPLASMGHPSHQCSLQEERCVWGSYF